MISGIKAIKEGATAYRAISTLAALMVVGLLGLKGREIAGAALQNATALALAASWREAMADPSSLFDCSPRGNAAAAWALAEAALRLKPEDAHAWLLQGRSAWLAGRCVGGPGGLAAGRGAGPAESGRPGSSTSSAGRRTCCLSPPSPKGLLTTWLSWATRPGARSGGRKR
jgi:hypothetical protein